MITKNTTIDQLDKKTGGPNFLVSRKNLPAVEHEQMVVDLFCGCGGLSTGLELAGFETIVGVDSWTPACDTFGNAHSTASVFNKSVTDLHSDDLLAEMDLDVGKLGMLCGGPPCQGFSQAGKSLADDPRNFLYKNFLEAVDALRPRWVLMENVPALLKNKLVSEAIQNDFRDIGKGTLYSYEVHCRVVNTADFGVPQTRSRVVFIAKRNDVVLKRENFFENIFQPLFSRTKSLFGEAEYVTLDETISDLPLILAGQGAEKMSYEGKARTQFQAFLRGETGTVEFFKSKNIPVPSFCGAFALSNSVHNHLAQDHSELLIERFANIPAGGSKEDLRISRPDLLPPEGHAEQGLTYGRLWPDRPATTIPANFSRPSGNRSIHPHVARLITPREAMRLSSFPDSLRLEGGKVAQREQIGNAVPPLLAFHIGRKIVEATI